MNSVLHLLSWLPLPLLRVLGALLGTLVYVASSRRRRITRTNLRLALASQAASHRIKLESLTWLHCVRLAQSLLDRAWMWKASERTVRERIKIEGLAQIPKDTPVILLVPHLVGLDAALCAALLAGLRITGFYQPQRNPKYDKIIYEGRMRFGDLRAYARQDGIRKVLIDMRTEKRLFYCLPDMDFGPKDSVFVPLFNEPAATLTVLPKMAKLTGAVVVPLIARMNAGGYRITVETPWSGMADMGIEEGCRRMNAAIEGWAMAAGAEYLWSHRRYKTRPPGERALY
jgi:Kdo2-lipid IVA lauroyltransferase/acyltransferase